MNSLDKKWKFALKKNSKRPAVDWSNEKNIRKNIEDINTKFNNIGLLTGPINDLLVVDVDCKDNGIEEMELYYKEYGEINTLTQKTPSGGYHLLFKYTSSNKDDQYLIDQYLKSKSKFRNKGIDIRSKGGYIVMAPSQINGIQYEFINDFDIIEIPSTLIQFLLNNSTQSTSINKKNNFNNFTYNITDDEIIEILFKLDFSYCDETNKWYIVTNILYGLNKFKIWDDWSTASGKYNQKTI